MIAPLILAALVGAFAVYAFFVQAQNHRAVQHRLDDLHRKANRAANQALGLVHLCEHIGAIPANPAAARDPGGALPATGLRRGLLPALDEALVALIDSGALQASSRDARGPLRPGDISAGPDAPDQVLRVLCEAGLLSLRPYHEPSARAVARLGMTVADLVEEKERRERGPHHLYDFDVAVRLGSLVRTLQAVVAHLGAVVEVDAETGDHRLVPYPPTESGGNVIEWEGRDGTYRSTDDVMGAVNASLEISEGRAA